MKSEDAPGPARLLNLACVAICLAKRVVADRVVEEHGILGDDRN